MSIGDKHLRDTFALMGSQVRDLDSGLQWGSRLNAEKPEQRPQAALAEIAGRFPMLECLQVGVAGYRMLYAVRGCVLSHDGAFEPHNLPNFTTVRFRGVPIVQTMICALARLPKLQVLEASLSPRSTWSEKLTPNAFPALRQLILMTTARTYITFSAIATLENVESAHLEITDSPEQSDIPALFQSVRQQFSPSSLRVLEICSRDDFYPEGAMQMGLVARPDHLESLFIFSKLIDLRLTLPCRYALDDACYLKIAHPFPLLRTLSLADCEDCIHDTLPSMSALAPFVQHSNLHTLSVAFNGSQQISLDNIKGALPPRDYPSSVRKPGVGYSPVARPQLVAAYLARHFPRVVGGGEDDLTYGQFFDLDTESGEREAGALANGRTATRLLQLDPRGRTRYDDADARAPRFKGRRAWANSGLWRCCRRKWLKLF